MLTGVPLSNKELNGMNEGFFDSAAAMSAKNRALKLQEDQLAQSKLFAEMQMDQAEKQQRNELLSNVGSTLFTDYMQSEPGESMIAKGWNAGKEALGYGGAKAASNVPQMFADKATFTEALSNATNTGQGVSLAGQKTIEAAPELVGEIAPATATAEGAGGVGSIATDAGTTAGQSVAPSTFGSIAGGVVSKVLPWVAVAQMGGKLGQQFGSHTLGLSDSNVGMQFADTLQHPWELSRWGELASGGEVSGKAKTFKDILDPIGALSDATVLCTELNRQGLLDDNILEDERKYIDAHITEQEYIGYRIIADPIVRRMKNSKRITNILAPLIRAFAYEMASRVNKDVKGSKTGKAILFFGLPLCRFVYNKRPLRVFAYKMAGVKI